MSVGDWLRGWECCQCPRDGQVGLSSLLVTVAAETSTVLCCQSVVSVNIDQKLFNDHFASCNRVRADPGKSWNFVVQNSRSG